MSAAGRDRRVLIIGGGVAGLSLAAELAQSADVTVLEAEDSPGFHASGRSATMLHYALGDRLVRSLTMASRAFFEEPPEAFGDAPLAHRATVLVHARPDETAALGALADAIAPFTDLDQVSESGLQGLCPLLKVGGDDAVAGIADRNALRLDSHALLQGFERTLRTGGGTVLLGARLRSVETSANGGWRVETERGAQFEADVLVNAAGAWADQVAHMAGVEPLGMRPLKRTIITFEAPSGVDPRSIPFTKTVGDELYFAPESGRLFASPMDEVPSEPCDAQPDEYEAALAAYRMEERTTIEVRRIAHRWAGLRTFAPDRHPVVGRDPHAAGFFWLAGQGGAGLQTSPALARIAAALILEREWPITDVLPDGISPERFR